MLLKNPLLHYLTIAFVFVTSLLFSLPNLYPDSPALKISASNPSSLSALDKALASDTFQAFHPSCQHTSAHETLCLFASVDDQMHAREFLTQSLPASFQTSLSLVESTPSWMQSLGLHPMKLGLDLRGGVHLLLNVETNHAQKGQETNTFKDILTALRSQTVSYKRAQVADGSLTLNFYNQAALQQAQQSIRQNYPQMTLAIDGLSLSLKPSQAAAEHKTDYIMNKTIESIEKRVNELGLSEAVVQKHGSKQISVDIPGIQDIEHAKSILGNTATLSFQLVNSHLGSKATLNQLRSQDSELVEDESGRTLAVFKKSVLSGDAITYATASSQEGKPVVQIQLGGGGEEAFYQTTRDNVGNQLAIIIMHTSLNDAGERVVHKKLISAPVIQQPLKNAFVISGLHSYQESDTLSLLLRSGSLAAPVDIIEEMTVGPTMGAENIQSGLFSIVVGFVLIMAFMLVYYRAFGIIANLALLFNLLLIVCLLSWLSATLTLPSMAAIVLTVGMAVDANVLINERIREELRAGVEPMTALTAGYDKAFATIFDANITTLIVSLVLYSLSSGMIKGFSVTLIIGIMASMFTSVYVTRVITWSLFPRINHLSRAIGI